MYSTTSSSPSWCSESWTAWLAMVAVGDLDDLDERCVAGRWSKNGI
jgi:hypothetical protein